MKIRSLVITCFLSGIIVLGSINAYAGWESGTRVGFNSNIDRSTDDGESDTYFNLYTSFLREPSKDLIFDWSAVTTVEGTAFASLSELDCLMISFAPGLAYFPNAFWKVNISPFLQAKVVRDSDQSALAIGGSVNLGQNISKDYYTGQYFILTVSNADVETYSFTEYVIGAFMGVNWSKALFSEIGYEFSRGDSFRSVSTTSTTVSGEGKHRTYSQVFESDVVREDINQHTLFASAGIDWSKSFFSQVDYAIATMKGDIGSSTSHTGSIWIGYRF